MGKANRIKSDLEDMGSLIEIIQILKDVASNHFYNTAKRKEKLEEFAIAFTDFFRMVSLSDATSSLVSPDVDATAVLLLTSEGGFMAEMTAKVVKAGLNEQEKYDVSEYLVIGRKGYEKLQLAAPEKKITKIPPGETAVEEIGLYATALQAKDYIIQQAKDKKLGRLFAVYPRARSLNLIKPYTIKLLPSEELLTKQYEIKDTIEKVLVESEVDDVIDYLAEMWLTCRIFEMMEDCVIAGFAAQSQQLESSLERMKKDKKGLIMGFRKAKKGDIDKSLREVFTAKTMSRGGRR
ncbi:F0F1 ATP synthase subunit gamma [Thermoproteota archaeon]